jgi:hypothetical protein
MSNEPVTKKVLLEMLADLPDDAVIYVSVRGGKVGKVTNIETHPTAGGEASAHLSGERAKREQTEAQ